MKKIHAHQKYVGFLQNEIESGFHYFLMLLGLKRVFRAFATCFKSLKNIFKLNSFKINSEDFNTELSKSFGKNIQYFCTL